MNQVPIAPPLDDEANLLWAAQDAVDYLKRIWSQNASSRVTYNVYSVYELGGLPTPTWEVCYTLNFPTVTRMGDTLSVLGSTIVYVDAMGLLNTPFLNKIEGVKL